MKYSIRVLSMTVAVITTLILFPVRVSAFWPFDSNGGQVKGAETTTQQTGISGLIQQLIDQLRSYQNSGRANTTTTTPVSGTSGMSGPGTTVGYPPRNPSSPTETTDPRIRLDQAVKEGKITQNQETEILSRLNAIRTKQQELADLQKSFYTWMQANKLTTAILGGPLTGPQGEPGGSSTGTSVRSYPHPSGYPSGYPTRNPTYYPPRYPTGTQPPAGVNGNQ